MLHLGDDLRKTVYICIYMYIRIIYVYMYYICTSGLGPLLHFPSFVGYAAEWYSLPGHLREALKLPCQVRHVSGQAQAPVFHESLEAQGFSQAKGTLPQTYKAMSKPWTCHVQDSTNIPRQDLAVSSRASVGVAPAKLQMRTPTVNPSQQIG